MSEYAKLATAEDAAEELSHLQREIAWLEQETGVVYPVY